MRSFDPEWHHRRSFRLRGFDYSLPGAYFITICARDRRHVFGEIVNGRMIVNDAGTAAQTVWRAIPAHFPGVRLDAFVVMPNHVHGVIVIAGPDVSKTGCASISDPPSGPVGATHASPLPNRAASRSDHARPPNDAPSYRPAGPAPCSVAAIVGSYKSAVSHRINRMGDASCAPIGPIWQRNYYEVIVRGDDALRRIRAYIEANPRNWNRARRR